MAADAAEHEICAVDQTGRPDDLLQPAIGKIGAVIKELRPLAPVSPDPLSGQLRSGRQVANRYKPVRIIKRLEIPTQRSRKPSAARLLR